MNVIRYCEQWHFNLVHSQTHVFLFHLFKNDKNIHRSFCFYKNKRDQEGSGFNLQQKKSQTFASNAQPSRNESEQLEREFHLCTFYQQELGSWNTWTVGLLKDLFIFIICKWVLCLHVWPCTMGVPDAHGSQKRFLDPLTLKINCYVGSGNCSQVRYKSSLFC